MDDFLELRDSTGEELQDILETAKEIKQNPEEYSNSLENRSLVMVFQHPSTRTRLSFSTGMQEMGGKTVYLRQEESQLSRGESLKDTAKVVSRYADIFTGRFEKHSDLEEFAKHSGIPVVNGLTDKRHPCQALSDLFTLREKEIDGKIAYVGDGNNVANSLINMATVFDRELAVATPEGHEPSEQIIRNSGDNVSFTDSPGKAVKKAEAVYTDKWVSMGEEKDVSDFKGFQVTQQLMDKSNDAAFMHCLPAERGKEVTKKVIDGPRSIVYDQAENRKHVQKALLLELLD